MKKILTVLLFLFVFTTLLAFAQEVRGIETRRVIYYGGPEYYNAVDPDSDISTRYYGWEVKNRNSITVSVDLALWFQGDQNKIVKTQSIVLNPGEIYVFKREEHSSTRVDSPGNHPISSYYIEYKAFKLQ